MKRGTGGDESISCSIVLVRCSLQKVAFYFNLWDMVAKMAGGRYPSDRQSRGVALVSYQNNRVEQE